MDGRKPLSIGSRKKRYHAMDAGGRRSVCQPVPRTGPDGKTVFHPQPIRRNRAVILARDGDGRITSIGTAEESTNGGKNYTLLEKRTVDAAGYLTIENKLFEASDRHSLGTRVPLTRLAQYEALPDRYTYPALWAGWDCSAARTAGELCGRQRGRREHLRAGHAGHQKHRPHGIPARQGVRAWPPPDRGAR